jgi:hypothetical protein
MGRLAFIWAGAGFAIAVQAGATVYAVLFAAIAVVMLTERWWFNA